MTQRRVPADTGGLNVNVEEGANRAGGSVNLIINERFGGNRNGVYAGTFTYQYQPYLGVDEDDTPFTKTEFTNTNAYRTGFPFYTIESGITFRRPTTTVDLYVTIYQNLPGSDYFTNYNIDLPITYSTYTTGFSDGSFEAFGGGFGRDRFRTPYIIYGEFGSYVIPRYISKVTQTINIHDGNYNPVTASFDTVRVTAAIGSMVYFDPSATIT